MLNFPSCYREFRTALATWQVAKTTDNYTRLLETHADLGKALTDTVKVLVVVFGALNVITVIASVVQLLS